jgi:hypothetical protein
MLSQSALWASGESAGAVGSEPDRVKLARVLGPELAQRLEVSAYWEMTLRHLLEFAKDGRPQPTAERVVTLSRYNLFMKPEEVQVVLRVAEESMDAVDQLRRPLDAEHGGTTSLGWSEERRKQQLSDIINEVIGARNRLQRELSPPAFRALKRYVAKGTPRDSITDIDP